MFKRISDSIFTGTIFAIALFSVFALTATAQESALDYTFGTNGRVINDLGTSFESHLSVAVQTDGKIVTTGMSSPGGSTLLMTAARYNPNGSLDATFGTNGIVTVNALNPATNSPFGTSYGRTVLIQPDGKIVLVGEGEFKYFLFARLNPDGSYDSTFGTNGRFVTTNSANVAYDAILQPDGKIVVGGSGVSPVSTSRTAFTLARVNSNGTLDTAFGTNGYAVVAFSANVSSDAIAHSLVLLPDGKILAGGFAAVPPGFGRRAALTRFNANGSLDTTFGSGGLVTDTPGGIINEIAVLPDGRIIAANGAFSPNNGTDSSQFGLTRYNANGSVDQTFGEFGRLTTAFPTTGSIGHTTTRVLIQPDGKILASGYVNFNGGAWVLARYQPDGTLDRTFGTGGRVEVLNAPGGNFDFRFYNMTLQADGKILYAGGSSRGDFYMVRLKARNAATAFDFDGDALADLSVFRPSNGVWYQQRSIGGFSAAQLGLAADKLAPADYDGDGSFDIAVWRDEPSDPDRANFYILESSTNTIRISQFGRTGDNPSTVGDWDADGKADLAVYRPSTSFFFYRPSSVPGANFVGIQWGVSGDEPVRGDFDGDGKMDAAVFRSSNQRWYIRQSSNNQARYESWGLPTDKRIAGDFDGDGKTDLTVFRDGVWYIRQSSNNQPVYRNWGLTTDRLVAADYDGDGKTDVAVWRDGIYYIQQSTNSQTTYRYFGSTGDIPVASAFIQ